MPGTRLFFIIAFTLTVVLAAGMAVPFLQSDDAIPEQVAAGYGIWRDNNCAGCHTLYGQGGAFAPDLTRIYNQRGDTYLREFMVNPNAFHPDQRAMPRFGLTLTETDSLLAFLQWAGDHAAAQNWPPRVIAVSGMGALGSAAVAAGGPGSAAQDSPLARGRALYSSAPAICSTCHSLEPDVVLVGPSLYGIADRAAARVPGQDAETYIRNAILYPSEYIVEGFADVMQKNFGDMLSSDDLNSLIAFLMTLRVAIEGGAN